MSRIVYKLFENAGEVREFSEDGLTLTVKVFPKEDGFITIGDAAKRLRDGEATFNLERFPDGDYTPFLFSNKRTKLEPIRKKDGRISPLPTPDSTVRRLLLRVDSAEGGLLRLEEKLDGLYKLIEGRIIF